MGIKTAKFGGMSSIAGAPGLEPGVSGFGDRYVTNYTIPLFAVPKGFEPSCQISLFRGDNPAATPSSP